MSMKDGQMTTILVHNILNEQNNHKMDDNMATALKSMQYVEYVPNNYQSEIQQKIRNRTFYKDRMVQKQTKTRCKFRKNIHRSIESDNSLKQPNIVEVQFDNFKRSKSKKQCSKQDLSNQYYSLMVNSMQKYMKKVEKQKIRKKQKCQKIINFGVNIKSISTKSNLQQKKQIAYVNNCIKPALQKKRFNKKAANINEDLPLNTYKDNINSQTLYSQKSSKNKLSETISHAPHRPKFYHKKVSLLKYDTKEQQKGISSKLNKMINFFSLILYSYGVYLNKTRQSSNQEQQKKNKKKNRYYYYIGKGNNKNLLISILKKRWWWVEADQMTSADFVWTQLKVSTILCKQTSMNYSDLEEAHPQLYKRSLTDKTLPTDNLSKFFHPDHSSQFYRKLSENRQRTLLRCMKPPNVLHNHYQANYMLGNKKALFHNICEYRAYKNLDSFQYMPLTFHAQKINSKAFKKFQKIARQNKNYMWIVKPGENSNRGQGIFVSDSYQKIKKKISRDSKHTYIIQKYIKNNFLFQRRKFDIRTYLLLVSIGGVKKFYWYKQGYLRTASQIYDLTDLDDPFIHLTNDAIQIDGQNYGKYEKGNKVTYHEFQRYLDINYPNQKYLVSDLIQKMKNIAKQIVQATYCKIDPCRKEVGLELFGLDFLVDSKFKPWVLQVNTNPCLQLSSPVLQRLIPRMIQNMFRIAIDPVFQPDKNQIPKSLACYIPQNIADTNRFQLIFDSLFDRDYSWEQFTVTTSSNQQYQDQDEQFDDDGDIIKIDY